MFTEHRKRKIVFWYMHNLCFTFYEYNVNIQPSTIRWKQADNIVHPQRWCNYSPLIILVTTKTFSAI